MNEYSFYKTEKPEDFTIKSGTTEITLPKIKDITYAESEYVEDKLKDLENASIIISRLSSRISQEQNIPIEAAALIVWGDKDSEAVSILTKAKVKNINPVQVRKIYNTEILKATTDIAFYSQKKAKIQAQSLVIGRLIEDPDEAKKFYRKLPKEIINQLANFWEKENAHWEEMGKLQQEKS